MIGKLLSWCISMIHCFYFRKWVREPEVELLP